MARCGTVKGAALAIGVLWLAAAAAPMGVSYAVQPGEALNDPELEARARSLSAGLRCLVCQNQSIDDSDAPLARDLRVLVRERISAGDSDAQVMDYLVARYGEFVLLKPPFGWHTLVLWLTPLVVLAGGTVLVMRALKAPAAPAATSVASPLTAEEEARLKSLIGEERAGKS